ncbi:MAG: hypothetical protein ACREI3_09080 [Nitrospirales bacterium]
MRTHPLIRRPGLVVLLGLMVWLPALSLPASDQPSQMATSSDSVEEQGVAASGAAARDTLEACLARIPKVASDGQRMMAEQSCERDEGARESIQAVPGS